MTTVSGPYPSSTLAASSLRSSTSTQQTSSPPQGGAEKTRTGPAAFYDLSDRAKSIIEQNKSDQAVADRLAEQAQRAKDPGGKHTSVKTPSAFDALNGGGGPPGTGLSSPNLSDRDAYLDSLIKANRQSDGTVKDFRSTVSDSFAIPTTPQDMDYWYRTNGESLMAEARQNPAEAATGIYQAIQNRTIKIEKASDIPDLNFHNTVTYEGGDHGSSVNSTESYNKNSSIFSDPNRNYRVSSNGYVFSWDKPASDATIGINFTSDPIISNAPPKRF